MREPGDHFLAQHAVGAAQVSLAAAVGGRLRQALAPLETQPRGHRDAVNEDGVVLVEARCGAEGRTHALIILLAVALVVAHGGVRPADPAGNVACKVPLPDADLVAGPVLHGKLAGLEVEEQRGGRVERPQLRGLAHAGNACQHALDAALLAHALVRGDDAEGRFWNVVDRHVISCFVTLRARHEVCCRARRRPGACGRSISPWGCSIPPKARHETREAERPPLIHTYRWRLESVGAGWRYSRRPRAAASARRCARRS